MMHDDATARRRNGNPPTKGTHNGIDIDWKVYDGAGAAAAP